MQKAVKKQHHTTEKSLETAHSAGSVSGQLSDVNKDVLNSLWKDLLGGGGKKASEQLFGASTQHGGDMKPGQEVSLKKKQEEQAEKKAAKAEGHMEYFREVKSADTISENRKDAAIEQTVEQIRVEIKKIMATSKELQATFKTVSVESKVVKAGRYHETFFTFVLSLLRSARVRMQEGASWMKTSKSKKQQRQYQSMAKKHGTSFTLNNERTVATQTG